MKLQTRVAILATTALAGSLAATMTFAQSTGSSTVEELVITASSGPRSTDGVLQQTAPKTRTTIDQEFISRQMPGQTVAETLNVVPGYNFTNNDAFGNSGGNIRLRSFDCARISFQWDGMQLNDTGNYACYTNQVGDSEIIASADVAQGTTDVDAPSASATGGAINYSTRLPSKTFGGFANLGLGSDNFRRAAAVIDTGEIGPFGTTMFVEGSYTDYDKFKGRGELEKEQVNARIYQPLRDNGDFASLAFHYNRNRNNFYNNPTMNDYILYGYKFEEDQTCNRMAPGAGTVQNENTGNGIVDFLGVSKTGSCTNFYGLRINPSDTANLRGQFKYHLTDKVIFTFDPSFQYVLANGGGFTVLSETDNRLRGAAGVTAPGRDLNGDGDTLDSVTTYSPSNTNTRRYGISSSLIWEINDNNRIRGAYVLDYGRHRQTGEFTPTDANGYPDDVFGGKDGRGDKIATNDGSFMRTRDRYSVAKLNMFAAEYVGSFLDKAAEVRLGVRAPTFERELNQFCYSQNGSSSVLCTTAPVASTLPNGNVTIAGQGTTEYIKPYQAEKKYDKVLPNMGASYKFGEGHSVYASYAESLSAPRTDNLYTVKRGVNGELINTLVNPETSSTIDVGYRFTTPTVQASIAVYSSKFHDRIATSFDPDLGISVDRNVGDVDIKGIDLGAAWRVADYLSYIGNISYNDSKVKDNVDLAGGLFLPTKGKRLVETPEWQWFQRVEWDIVDSVSLGVQAKYVGQRYATDVNDEKTQAYSTVDTDLRWDLPFNGGDKMYLQLNVRNIFDKKYLGSISSQTNAISLPGSNAFAPRYSPGAPRSFEVTLHVAY